MKTILVVIGTRPEAIKMAPVILQLKKYFHVQVCATSQHKTMLRSALEVFDIQLDHDLDIMQLGQDLFDITSNVLLQIKNLIYSIKPDLILVHGDTTTTMSAALAAFYLKVLVGHVEAGLRTYDINSPYPEEFNRQVASQIAAIHFAPTENAKNNLLYEKKDESKIFITGNTVIDALLITVKKIKDFKFVEQMQQEFEFLGENKKLILVTGHRRENFGDGFREICYALREIAEQRPEINIIYPVHLNPNVREPVQKTLSNIDNIYLIEPLDYLKFVYLMERSYLVLTDSGGIQEEAPSLGKPVLVMREVTERPEAIQAGTVELVGTSKHKIVDKVLQLCDDSVLYNKMSFSHNPYGDGLASERICNILREYFA